jgi:uncharacterized protein (TIGR02145 family)
MKKDQSGNLIIAGTTESSNYPTTSGAYDESYNGGSNDVFLTKLNTNGATLVFSTFIGSSNFDQPEFGVCLTIDASDNIILAGTTTSSGFPTTSGAYDRTHNGNQDIVLCKINSSGSSLIYSTFVGASSSDFVLSIIIDDSGNPIISGWTASSGYPTTVGAYDQSHNGGWWDNYVTKINSSGSALIYSTFIGGNAIEYQSGIAIDGYNNVVIAGSTYSSNYPTTVGCFDNTFNGSSDGFVTKLNSNGTALIFSTYFGGNNHDGVSSSVFDGNGDIYITGGTASSDFYTTSGSYDENLSGTSDGFVAKLNSSGTSLLLSTLIGGSNSEQGYSIILDEFSNVIICGITSSSNFPTTTDAYDLTYNGGTFDGFLCKLNSTLSNLIYSTYIGGSLRDDIFSILLFSNNEIGFAGYTESSNYPTTSGSWDENFSGGTTDCYITKLTLPSHPDTVVICNQTWMTRNLDVTTYRNGDAIPQITDNTAWANATSGAWCYYNNDPANGAIYGKLYNWYAVNDSRGLAPEGWKIASDDDWKELEMCLGMSQAQADATGFRGTDEGSKIAGRADLWTNGALKENSNFGNCNLSIVPLADRNFNGWLWGTLGSTTYQWTSTNQNYRLLVSDRTTIHRGVGLTPREGCAVRCIRDYNSLNTGSVNSDYCEGETIRISYTANGTYNAGNTFTAQLSNSSGNFSSPTTLGNVTSTASGTITGTIPSGVQGTGFRVRVVSSNPAVTGSDNGTNIVINPLPSPQITAGDNVVCAKNIEQYTGNTSSGCTNKWTVTSNSGTITGADDGTNVNIYWGGASSGTLTLTQTNSTTGCKDSVKIAVTINPLPVPTITGIDSLCKGSAVKYFANRAAGLSYEWIATNGTISGANNHDSVIVNWVNSGSGKIKLIQTNSNNCIDSTEKNITVNPLPMPQITAGADSVCDKNVNIYLSNADANVNYQWIVEKGTITTGATAQQVTVLWDSVGVITNGKIKLIQTNKTTGCKDSIEWDPITINPLPKVNILGSLTVGSFLQESYHAKDSSGVSSSWFVTGGSFVGSSTNHYSVVNWGGSGNGSLKLIQTNLTTGCKDSAIISISILDNPPIVINVLDSACENQEYIYTTTSNPNITYKWRVWGGDIPDDIDNQTSVRILWGQSGIGTLRLIRHNNQLNTDDSLSKDITIHPLPSANIIADLDLAITGSTVKYWTNKLTNINYRWQVTGGTIVGANNKDTVDVKWGAIGTGILKLIATNSITSCIDSATKDISIKEKSGLNINGDMTVCEGDTVDYSTAQVANTTNQWIVSNGKIINQTNLNLKITWETAGTGIVKIVQKNTQMNTSDSTEIEVTIHPLPNVTLDDLADICYEDTTYILEGGKPVGGKYYFDDIQRTTFNPIERGIGSHKVLYEYTNDNGCTNFAEKTFVIHPVPTVSANSDSIKVWSGTSAKKYEWYYGEPPELVSSDSVYFPPKEKEGDYYLKVFNEWGCESILADGGIYFPSNPTGPRITTRGKLEYDTLVCNSFIEDTIIVYSVGSEKIIITKAEIVGTNKDDFRITAPNPAVNVEINSKDSLLVLINFEPKSTGLKTAQLNIENNDPKKPLITHNLTGRKDSVAFEINPNEIKFENVKENSKAYNDIIKLKNTGTKELYWHLPIKINNDFDIMSIDPNPTPVNNESIVTIRFNGGANGYKTLYDYLLSEENCGRSSILKLSAIVGDVPVDATAFIRVDSSINEYKPGDEVIIPVYLENSQNLEKATISGFTADLVFNATLLVPIKDTPMGKRVNDIRTIPITLRLPPKQGNILENYYFEATLGNDTTTALVLENLKSIGDSIQVSKTDGRFTLAGVCIEGGQPRLIDASRQIALHLLRPNPTEDKLTIEYEIIESGKTEIYLVNSFGIRVKDILSLEGKVGSFAIDADLRDLSSGMYFIVLETPTVRKMEKVEVIK